MPGLAVGQPRVRACVRAGHAHVYDPGTADAWRAAVRQAVELAAADAAREEEEGAVAVDLAVRIPRAKAHYSTSTFSLRPSAPTYPIKKPDVDNLAKAILDELGRGHGGIIKDDKQVVALSVAKRYVGPGEKGGATIRIWREPDL